MDFEEIEGLWSIDRLLDFVQPAVWGTWGERRLAGSLSQLVHDFDLAGGFCSAILSRWFRGRFCQLVLPLAVNGLLMIRNGGTPNLEHIRFIDSCLF